MLPSRLLPALALVLLFNFTLQAQSFRISSGALRQPISLSAGAAHFSICDLVPGQTYTAVLTGLPGGVVPEWHSTGAGRNRDAGGALRFRAVSACQTISCNLVGTFAPTQGHLSVWADRPTLPQSRNNAVGLEVSYASSPGNLIADALFGNSCNEVSNVTFNGQISAIGTFTNGQTNVGISEGIVLATGDVSILEGPNTQSNATGGYGIFSGQDPHLAAIAAGTQFDLNVIEFDVTPSASNLSFQFVFGSEEYCEYVGSSYNDVFGMFITGPGINGTQNLARLPATNIPVSTNTVNHISNIAYYVNNNNFEFACENLPPVAPNECQLDGWTKVLAANVTVIPCSTYHVKIAIADIGDGVWDSAVFLRAFSSISSNMVKASVVYPNNQNTAYEDCQTGQIRIRRTGNNTALPIPVSFTVSGTATPGIDYAPLISPVVIPAGQTEILLPVLPVADGLAEGNETILLDVFNACDCGQGQGLTFTIGELLPLTLDNPDINDCSSTTLLPQVNGGLSPYTYQWSDGSTQPELLAFHPAGVKVYTVTVTDQCGHLQTDAATVTLYTPPPANLLLPFCDGDSVEIFGQVFNDSASLLYEAPGVNGQCDTSINIQVFKVTVYPRQQNITLCPGQTVTLDGNTYTAPATVNLTQPGANGACDTVTTYVLQSANAVTRNEMRSFCQGTSVTINGVVYTDSGTVLDTFPGAGPDCDTLVTYTLLAIPPTTFSDTLTLCPGDVFSLGGQDYTAPATVTETRSGLNGQCDSVFTHILLLKTPAPSNVSFLCPSQITNNIDAGAALPVIIFNTPAASSDCPCPGMTIEQTGGLPSGTTFPMGITTNCFIAKDACGNTASCCFQVTVQEKPPCDVKTSGCIKWETISVKEDAEGRTTFRVRVTNNCANQLVSADFQLPKGLVAEMPLHNTVYTAPSGRDYLVTNPNFSPFYSIRFASMQTGISGGGSDIFEYTLQPQAEVTYILALVRLSPAVYYAAHINTFKCFTSQQSVDRSTPEYEVQLFPNPTDGLIFVETSGSESGTLPARVLDSKGALVLNTTLAAGAGPQPVQLPESVADGVYLLEVMLPDGKVEVLRFMLLRK